MSFYSLWDVFQTHSKQCTLLKEGGRELGSAETSLELLQGDKKQHAWFNSQKYKISYYNLENIKNNTCIVVFLNLIMMPFIATINSY